MRYGAAAVPEFVFAVVVVFVFVFVLLLLLLLAFVLVVIAAVIATGIESGKVSVIVMITETETVTVTVTVNGYSACGRANATSTWRGACRQRRGLLASPQTASGLRGSSSWRCRCAKSAPHLPQQGHTSPEKSPTDSGGGRRRAWLTMQRTRHRAPQAGQLIWSGGGRRAVEGSRERRPWRSGALKEPMQ
jgi:hypothetical protein